jgi:hypothetical protein
MSRLTIGCWRNIASHGLGMAGRLTASMVWPLGGRAYQVNDARKAELLRRPGQWRYWIKRPMSLP